MDVLIVVDMQNDFIDGALGTPEAVQIIDAVKRRIETFDGEVIYTRDTHGEDYAGTQEGRRLPVAHCIRGTAGHAIRPELPVIGRVFDKPGFGSPELIRYLKARDEAEGIDSITFVGLCTDICVIVNAMTVKSLLPEVPLIVDARCCAGATPEGHRNALAAMAMCQIEIQS